MPAIDLSSIESTWTYHWLRQHIAVQPADNKSLTWFVGAGQFYRAYSQASQRAGKIPFNMAGLWEVLNILYPNIKDCKQGGIPVFTGIRFIKDGCQVFGL